MATRRIKEITNTATTFASDDFIALDGTTQGTRKMDKDDLIAEVSAGVSGDYLEEANNLSDVASLDTSKLNMEIPDVGTAPNEVPLNGQLGTMAFQDSAGVSVEQLEVESTTGTATTQALTVTDGSSTKFVVQEDGRTGINNSSPGTNANSNADDLVVGNGGEHGITIYSGSANNGRLFFSDGTGSQTYRGIIRYDHSSNSMIFGTNSSDRVTIDSSGRLGVNQSTPGSYNANADDLVVGDGSGDRGMTIVGGTGNNSTIYFADGTGADAYRGRVQYNHLYNELRLGTSGSTRWTINSTGNLVAGANLGIDFGSTTSGSGTVTGGVLSDYEEGDWTPSVSVGSITGTGLTYVGKYTKIGRLVNIYIRVNATAQDINVSSYVGFAGVPFSFSAKASGTVIGEDIDVTAQQGFASLTGTILYFGACGNSSAIGLTATLTGYI
jgi:hypothetical protein